MKDKEVYNAFNKALDIEREGYKFYSECANRTYSKTGKETFSSLARDEEDHFKRIEYLYKKYFEEFYCEYKRKDKKVGKHYHKVKFFELVKDMDEKSDALDAIAVAINAEKESIALYTKLSEKADNSKMKTLFEKLVSEEEKHQSILETEREFLTETGAYYDFKTVTT